MRPIPTAEAQELDETGRRRAAQSGLGHAAGATLVQGGRAALRGVLYMGALVAARRNPVIREFYLRLAAVGKPKKLALVAC